MGTRKEQESEQQQEPIFESPEAQTAYYEAQKKKYEGIHTVLKHTRNGAIVFLIVGGGILTWQAGAPYVVPLLAKAKEPLVRTFNSAKSLFQHGQRSLASETGAINPGQVGFRTAPKVTNPRLQRAIGQLYKKTDELPGGTAGAIRHQLRTGEFVKGKPHMIKGKERISQLQRILREENLNFNDLKTAEKLLEDLRNALAGK